jgi:hypothetical protein
MLSVCLYIPPIYFWMPEPAFTKLGMYVCHDTWGHLNGILHNPSHQSVCLYVYLSLSLVARQRLVKNFTTVTNISTTIAELLEVSFSMRCVSYQGKQAINSSQNFLIILNILLEIVCKILIYYSKIKLNNKMPFHQNFMYVCFLCVYRVFHDFRT